MVPQYTAITMKASRISNFALTQTTLDTESSLESIECLLRIFWEETDGFITAPYYITPKHNIITIMSWCQKNLKLRSITCSGYHQRKNVCSTLIHHDEGNPPVTDGFRYGGRLLRKARIYISWRHHEYLARKMCLALHCYWRCLWDLNLENISVRRNWSLIFIKLQSSSNWFEIACE